MLPRPGDRYGVLVPMLGDPSRWQALARAFGTVPRTLGQAALSTWSSRSWRATVHVLVGLPVSLVPFGVAGGLAATAGFLAVGVAGLAENPTATAALGLLAGGVLSGGVLLALALCVRGFTTLQRSRFRGLLGVSIPPLTRSDAPTAFRRLVGEAFRADTARQTAYHLIAPALCALGGGLVTALWSVGVAISAIVGYSRRLPTIGPYGWRLHDPTTLAVLTGVGLLCLAVAPWTARGWARFDALVAGALLGPSRSAALARRVADMATSRAGMVAAAQAERRRIERDLHDGAQQRLVSLAMNLGRIRVRAGDAPESTRRAIAEAHEEAKCALREMRDFVRGLHPVVLNDRGLDAALSGIAARSPVPVRLSVDIRRRYPATTEAIAYFVVAEALTNAAKHARASLVEVHVCDEPPMLRITVTDDGRGGARVDTAGSGLRGLAQRAAAVDGTLRIDSPPGGPTVVELLLPGGS